MPILATQQKFDKAIPIVFGNAEYNTERELLITIDEIIRQSGLEKIVTAYFLDAARVNKMIAVFGTDKPVRLTEKELMRAKDDAVLALRASILRKRLKLSLRKFALALSHSDLYKWFCRINRFFDPKGSRQKSSGRHGKHAACSCNQTTGNAIASIRSRSDHRKFCMSRWI